MGHNNGIDCGSGIYHAPKAELLLNGKSLGEEPCGLRRGEYHLVADPLC